MRTDPLAASRLIGWGRMSGTALGPCGLPLGALDARASRQVRPPPAAPCPCRPCARRASAHRCPATRRCALAGVRRRQPLGFGENGRKQRSGRCTVTCATVFCSTIRDLGTSDSSSGLAPGGGLAGPGFKRCSSQDSHGGFPHFQQLPLSRDATKG
jgi:hypothetical protein